MRDTLLLLAAPSRESRDKAEAFAAAARALSLKPRIVIAASEDTALASTADAAGILFALPCSDALGLAAARLNAAHATGGFSPGIAALLSDKATGIPFMSRLLGLPMLPQIVPLAPADIEGWRFGGPVMVKPSRSSGSRSPDPWGYRCFENGKALLGWLSREKLTDSFFAAQHRPGPLGPALVQALLGDNRVEIASLLLTPEQATVFAAGQIVFEGDGTAGNDRRWRQAIFHAAGARKLRSRLPRLRRQNWGRGLLYLQGLRGPFGRLHLIDINLRLSTAWTWLAATAMPQAHYRLLSALLFDMPLEFEAPAHAMAIDLVHGEVGRPPAAIAHPRVEPGILPWRLTPASCAGAESGFDKSSAAPSFITLANTVAACAARADAFRAAVSVSYARESAA